MQKQRNLKEEQNTFDPVAAAKPKQLLVKQFQLAEEKKEKGAKALKKLLLGRNTKSGVFENNSSIRSDGERT